MNFFKPTRTEEQLKQALRLGNIKQWWKSVCDEYSPLISFLTYQTSLISKTISELTIEVKNETYSYDLEQLILLYYQVLNWQIMHNIRFNSSSRNVQIDILKEWLEERIYPPTNSLNTSLIRYQHMVAQASKELDLMPVRELPELNDQLLYDWWKMESHVGFFSWRTKATTELDELVYWYSNSVILDKLDALQKMMAAIYVWLNERQSHSHPLRVTAVKELQKVITLEMIRELEKINNEVILDNNITDNTLRLN
ncbi:hypothetical protein ACNVED_00355 [Legionella sp. D16C41]|uniref:hypothetical protein n=1 Tax=Legionella sp. D16C41 TaxID=3402688 RepID=UPI003AF5E52A